MATERLVDMATERLVDMATARLVDMANQIAMNVPDRHRAAEETAAHLHAFWTPAMIRTLDDHLAVHAADVSAEVIAALTILRAFPTG